MLVGWMRVLVCIASVVMRWCGGKGVMSCKMVVKMKQQVGCMHGR